MHTGFFISNHKIYYQLSLHTCYLLSPPLKTPSQNHRIVYVGRDLEIIKSNL